ncbi:MAG: GNAT family acetyltransferase [Alphaproteobacteria bacterium]
MNEPMETPMEITLEIRDIKDGDVAAVIDLWRAAGLINSRNDPHQDLEFARAGPASQVLVGICQGALRAAVLVGHDGHRGVVYYLGVDPGHQKAGLGRQMLHAAEQWLAGRGVWKLNLMLRANNASVAKFYKKMGYEIEDRVVMSRRLD